MSESTINLFIENFGFVIFFKKIISIIAKRYNGAKVKKMEALNLFQNQELGRPTKYDDNNFYLSFEFEGTLKIYMWTKHEQKLPMDLLHS